MSARDLSVGGYFTPFPDLDVDCIRWNISKGTPVNVLWSASSQLDDMRCLSLSCFIMSLRDSTFFFNRRDFCSETSSFLRSALIFFLLRLHS